jgi:hypothetical protein
MKKMNRWTWIVPGLFLVLALAFAACDSATSSDGGGNQYAQVSGLVVDGLELAPLADVTVRLGDLNAKTDENGIYKFSNVPPGDYLITFEKDGYAFNNGSTITNVADIPDLENPGQWIPSPAAGTIFVSPIAYKSYDPNAEYEALMDQLEALQQATFPAPGAATNGQWTLTEGGVTVNGDGTQVSYNNGLYEVKSLKLTNNYSYGLQVAPATLTPLIGRITGKIIAVAENRAVANIDYPASVRSPLVNAAVYVSTTGATPKDYGPFQTNADGVFEATGLPVTGALNFKIPATTQDSKTYIHNTTVGRLYQYSQNTGVIPGVYAIPAAGVGPSGVDAGELWLFTVGDTAVVTDAAVGTIANPLAVSDSILFTFNVPMNPQTLPALTLGTLSLKASWNADFTVLTLTPAGYLANSTQLRLPYGSTTAATGTINFAAGPLVAANGAALLTTSFNVYTSPALALKGYEVVSAAATPARAVSIPSGGSVKLTFNQPLSTLPGDASAAWGVNTAAIKVVNTADEGALYVYAPAALNNAPLTFSVAAENDPSNTVTQATAGLSITDLTFSEEAPLELKLVNGSTTTGYVTIAQDGDITLDFNKDFTAAPGSGGPTDITGTATLYFEYGSPVVYNAVVVTANSVAGTHSLKLVPGSLLAKTGSTLPVGFKVISTITENSVVTTNTITVNVSAVGPTPKKGLASLPAFSTTYTKPGTTASTVTLNWTAPSLAFAADYEPEAINFNFTWDDAVPAGAPISIGKYYSGGSTGYTFNLPGTPPYATGATEKIKIRLTGITGVGYEAATPDFNVEIQ